MTPTPANIPELLLPLAVPIGDLTPYYRNPRNGDLPSIAESLTVNGQYRAIVVNKGTHTGRHNEILAGNHTYAAAQQLGWEQIAVTWVDVDDDAAARIVIVDNRTNDLAGYDSVLLAEILSEIPDLAGTGYDRESVDRLLDDTSLPETLELTSDGAGTGAAATVDYLQWGYLQWESKRVRITSEEVEALNTIYTKFVDDTNSDLGFGWHVLQEAHQAGDPE
ncbi:ParB N-terminal domain-containing protein [Streptomyces sp. NBC_01262]|uniref:ParB N-terminal domain-containing protein n=1 Tax=Streptomyces sp. NBC_01262 TaxID=2903803 RepID=UPI002E30DE1A|nr:ParB N-terminal domain-containing protein [Streptomyces sp. NBC_01262]